MANYYGLKFYSTQPGPTVVLTREWAEEADEIDGILKQKCGNQARWNRIFAVGDIANHVYCLFKKGIRRLTFNEISFTWDQGNLWIVNLEDDVEEWDNGEFSPV